jgi:hypothetical protein
LKSKLHLGAHQGSHPRKIKLNLAAAVAGFVNRRAFGSKEDKENAALIDRSWLCKNYNSW